MRPSLVQRLFLKMTLVFSMLVSFQAAVADTASCKLGDKRPSLAAFKKMVGNKSAFEKFISSNFTNSENYIEEFICCLPPELQKEARYSEEDGQSADGYELITYSRALQTGHARSPRLLFWLEDSVFSINGNDSTQSGHAKIEMAQWQQGLDGKRAEYFAGGFKKEGAFHFSESNGKKTGCIGCHTVDGRVPEEGVRAIFQPKGFWNRMADGIGSYDCANYRPYFQEIRKQTSAWFHGNETSKNENFRCLEKPSPEADRGRFLHLSKLRDQAVAKLDAHRLLRKLKSTPQFEKFKYVFVGQNKCSDLKLEKDNYSIQLSLWLPRPVIENIRDDRMISPEIGRVAEPQSIEKLGHRYRQEINKQMKANRIVREQQMQETKKLQTNSSYRRHLLEVSNAAVSICSTQDIQSAEVVVKHILSDSDRAENPYLLNLFIVDTLVKSHGAIARSGQSAEQSVGQDSEKLEFNGVAMTSPVFRFLLEGRGISMLGWDMMADATTYSRNHSALIDLLIETDPELKEISSSSRDDFCQALRQKSFSAF